ncbi:MAG TPA: 3-octaprenyl-4-hydroxybenzoate carboxy-lyase [Planctomycetaceae bacterium]|nr:3-octaprenyl-4-hydroxybenzoate carboxy-lyase [Planctomycetaceae bacterium]
MDDLLRHGKLLVVEDEVDPHLELAEIHRRVYRSGGPALLFSNIRGSRFPVASNLLGDLERARFVFRKTLDGVKAAVRWKASPEEALKRPWELWRAPAIGLRMLPRRTSRASVMKNTCQVSELPHVTCWPNDGGAFVTLPQVLSQSPEDPSHRGINLGMYRVQLSGGEYERDREVGLHYQLHRGIGVHHQQAIARGKPLAVNVSVGGAPAMTLAAVMPLPEGMSELMFAGALGGHRIPITRSAAPIYADADFCITGRVQPGHVKPEGPFGDHLGYYAKVHDFPVLTVDKVFHRNGAVWPMTVVGRPPQEDTVFGELIHELTGPVIPTVLPGVRGVHAVDAAGVHPLLLAVGSERYTPYSADVQRPQELLTQACAILGQGQLSLAKYLFICDGNTAQCPSVDDIPGILRFVLERVDWRRDLHFHTSTTIDTLDYTGDGLNQGSKLVVAATGPPQRELPANLPSGFALPSPLTKPRIALPGVLVVEATSADARESIAQICKEISAEMPLNQFPLVVVVDNSEFATRSLENFLWNTFTRSNPAADIDGVESFTQDKHFGCRGSLLIDARSKPHHADGLVEDPETMAKVDARATKGDKLAQFL